MCGRIVQHLPAREIADYFEAEPLVEAVGPHFNLAPAQPATIVVVQGGRRILASFGWGLTPSWGGPALINARAETLATSPAFADAFARRRCLVPVSGFYEWQRAIEGRQPFLIRRIDRMPFALAGLWASALDPATGAIESTFTIVTTPANAVVGRLHDRMPAVLAPGAWHRWLDPAVTDGRELRDLLQPAPADLLEAHPVSRRVNDVRNDDPRLLEPLESVPVALEQLGLFEPDALA